MLSILLSFSEVQSREELRFAYSAEQGYDTSCGLSTLACLFDTYWSIPSNEFSLAREFLADKLIKGDFTVSFADLTSILKARGFTYAAFRMDFGQLKAAMAKYAPILVHYDRPEGHFALALDVADGRIILADPAEGTVARERGEFESRWSGYCLLATLPGGRLSRDKLAKAVESVLGRETLLDRAALAMAGIRRW
jgi:hypothetical protein